MRRPGRLAAVLAAGAVLLAGCSITIAGEPTITPSAGNSAIGRTGQSLATATARSTTARTTAPPTSTRPSTTSAQDLHDAHDAVTRGMLDELAAALRSGNRAAFLKLFDPKLAHRVGAWFDNNRRLGVAYAEFWQSLTEQPGTDTVTRFGRIVVLGVRSSYDDTRSLPAIAYAIGVARTGTTWRIADWAPKYVDDPMNCDCTLTVAKGARVAVVSEAGNDNFDGWPQPVLEAAVEADGWLEKHSKGTGLTSVHGHVVFLADKPYTWLQRLGGEPEQSNATIPIADAGNTGGPKQTRVVLELVDSQDEVVPPDESGRLYVSDVLSHEFTHQLMAENSALTYGSSTDPIDTWMVEGIAVAMEVLHRRDHPEAEAIGYSLPDDLGNVDQGWIADHVRGPLPTRKQLYESNLGDRNRWYALAGSVFLYISAEYGVPTMLKVAGQLYAANNRTPFAFLPDKAHPGKNLASATAQAHWQDWVEGKYLG